MSTTVPQLLKAFKKADKDGKGKIGRFQLAEVLQELDELEWTPDDLNELFDSVDEKDTGYVKYHRFIKWVMEDDDGKVQDAAADDGDDDDESDDDEDNEASLEAAAGLADSGLDLNQTVTEKEFMMIMRRLDEEKEEAQQAYRDILQECADDGIPTAAGIPILEVLDHLDIDPEDRDSLRHLKEVLQEVLQKEAVGEEDPAAERKAMEPALTGCFNSLCTKDFPQPRLEKLKTSVTCLNWGGCV